MLPDKEVDGERVGWRVEASWFLSPEDVEVEEVRVR